MKIPILKCIVISFCAAYSHIAYSQVIFETYNYARELYQSGKFEQSVIELERIALFSDIIDKECYLLMAECKKNLHETDESVKFYKKAQDLEEDDSIKMEISFKIILLHMKYNQPIYALIELNSMQTEHSDYFNKKKLFFLVTCHFLLKNYEQSEEYMNDLSNYFPKYDSLYVNSIYCKALRNNSRKTKYYSVFSAILPGSGQFFSGAYQEGIDSFLLNALLISSAIITVEHLSLLDAALSLSAIIKRYYTSGIRRSKVIAEQKKEEKRIDLYNNLLEYINDELYTKL